MNPDQAAELLQLEERGLALLKLCEENDKIYKAIQKVQAGFSPRDVAALYGLDYDVEEEELESTGNIQVWQCRTARCRQRERVSTADDQPDCPGCGKPMHYMMSVEDAEEISHLRRTTVGRPRIDDPLYRTDRTRENAPVSELGDPD